MQSKVKSLISLKREAFIMSPYDQIKKTIARDWNTWNTRSVLSHVLLPEAFALNLAIKEYRQGHYLKEAFIGKFSEHEEKIHPGAHAYDGSYTELNLKWQGLELIIQSAAEGDDLVLLVTPLANHRYPPTLVVESGLLWNRPGTISLQSECLTANLPGRDIKVYTTKASVHEPGIAVQTPYIAMAMDGPTGISTGSNRGLEEIRTLIEKNRQQHNQRMEQFGQLGEVYNAMQSCMAWDTIYEPRKDRVVSTVSRLWNIGNGGYVLFCWDNYFAAFLASLENKELAYCNAIEMTREKTPDGFVPNCAWGTGFSSLDRSQPPVGSMVVRELYRKFGEKWLLEELFDDLYIWNTWFYNNRRLEDGSMAWGSSPYEATYENFWETAGVNETYGGALESGLDNSPMYDDIPFDTEKHHMKLADVGLTGLYSMDCQALADIARILGRSGEAAELACRAENCSKGLANLWDKASGIFLNRRTDTGEFSPRMSPTNFYALFSDTVTHDQAQRMLEEHFYNPEEFWGDWVLPSISRNDPAYRDQNYWRGRIWAPMNFLVYLGLRKHNLRQACKDLAEKSEKLIMKEWLALGHVHENYSAETGDGCGIQSSDKFYHWGGLLSLISLMEAGYVEGPEKEIKS
jgi:putative isomerase